MLSFFPRGVLDEILNLIESVSEGFLPTLYDPIRQHNRFSTSEVMMEAEESSFYYLIIDLTILLHVFNT